MGSLFLLIKKGIDMPERRIRCSVCGLLHNAEDIRRTNEGKYICKSCIENSDGEYVECSICGKVEHCSYDEEEGMYTGAYTDIGEETVCRECRDIYYYQCANCGHWTLKRDLIEMEGILICPDCQDDTEECSHCGQRHLRGNMVTVHLSNGETTRVCRSCTGNYRRCTECGEYFARELVHNTSAYGTYICDSCIESRGYQRCPSCGNYVTELVSDEDELDEPVCSRCYTNQANCIHGYHCDENFVKRSHSTEQIDSNTLFMGLEIEVGGDRGYARKFLKYFRPNNDIMLMDDSSVRGFEIVTNPMTYKYIQLEFYPKLEEGLNFLISKGFRGHNEGGIHIHISEEAVTKLQVAQISEILYGNNNDFKTWLILSQRKESNTHWCSFKKNKTFYSITDDTCEKPSVDGQRHTALNHDSRTRTYEFRIFNSSLRMDRIKKNIQCVIALLDYTADHKYDERPVCNLTSFLDYVMARKIFYPELVAFIEEKNLVEAHKNKDYSCCEERTEICA